MCFGLSRQEFIAGTRVLAAQPPLSAVSFESTSAPQRLISHDRLPVPVINDEIMQDFGSACEVAPGNSA
jgi:hypothetical protein